LPAAGPSFQPPLADRRPAIYAVAADGRALPAAAGTHALDKALKTPDRIAARAAAALDFRDDINGLRALAVLGVVVFHADRAWLPGGFSGVDVFFVISGFLISRIILTECVAGRFSLTMFYAKRARRILPALILVVSFVFVLGWFRADPLTYRDIGYHLMGNSYFTANFWILHETATGGYFAPDAAGKPLLHLWSLSIEEQFYLVWATLLLLIFKLPRPITLVVFLAVFVASLAFCLFETPNDPISAFYVPWTRGWELALGALLAYREVFLIEAAPHPSPAIASFGAGLGLTLILCAFLFLGETQPFPGWRALIPTSGCALVIALPRSALGGILLGNPVAAFFGIISYPLYLWHWPLFAFANIWAGVVPTPSVMFTLAAAAVVLAALTYWLIERPAQGASRRRPYPVAAGLLGALALTGVVGRVIVEAKGFPGRLPPLVTKILNVAESGMTAPDIGGCMYNRDNIRYPLDEERKRAREFFSHCTTIKDPSKPTIMIVGDSHATHLFAGLSAVYGKRANLVALTATYCVPLIEHVSTEGWGGTTRCQAVNDYVLEEIRRIKPDLLLVGAYFVQYVNDPNWLYPGYVDAFANNARRLRDGGVGAVIVAGEIPTWSPSLPALVGREVLDGEQPLEFSNVGLRPESLKSDRILAAKDWGEGIRYVSQVAKLCGPEGCRRLVGENLPEDLLAVDYGHYSINGSIFAVRTILAPAIDAELARLGKN
jgi:peptidoglycan/LPS O-acetylase OafA/YrhL